MEASPSVNKTFAPRQPKAYFENLKVKSQARPVGAGREVILDCLNQMIPAHSAPTLRKNSRDYVSRRAVT